MIRFRCLALLLTTACLSAQTVREGYRTTVSTLPTDAGQPLVVGQSVVYFTGTDLVLSAGSGKRKLLTLPSKVFGSFIIQVAPDTLLFGESSTGGIWLVPMGSTGSPRQLNSVQFNYAAAAYDANWAILSARTGGLSAKDNDLIAIHLSSGLLDPLARIPGASGPVVVDGHGNLLYATGSAAFPPPKGTVEILHFDAARVAAAFGPTRMDRSDAATIVRGLDAAGSMVLDGDHDLLITDWMNQAVVEISEIHTASPKTSTLSSYSRANVSASGLQFVAGSRTGLGMQEFEAFQPAGAGSLWIHETAFGTVSQLRRLDSERPATAVTPANPVPANNNFRITVAAGPASGTGVIALGLGGHRREVAVPLPHEQPVFWADALLRPIYFTPVVFDAAGNAHITLFNPGFQQPVVLTVQCFLVDRPGVDAGSSTPLTCTLR